MHGARLAAKDQIRSDQIRSGARLAAKGGGARRHRCADLAVANDSDGGHRELRPERDATRPARAKAAREDAERRLATRANDSRAKRAKREDTKNTQTPVGELSREELLERARGALPRRANAAGDTGIPGGA